MRTNFMTRLHLRLPTPMKALSRAAADALKSHRNPTWSQEGEDRIIWELLKHRRYGFYVDVGAHHPKRYSNTYLLYRAGWNGLNIEPDPDLIRAFGIYRRRDFTIQAGVARTEGVLGLHRFADPALNTFDPQVAELRKAEGWPWRDTINVRISPLVELLRSRSVQQVDFLNVDTEGYDHEVLLSNDWQQFRPAVVAVEIPTRSALDTALSDSHKLMTNQGYVLIAKTLRTAIYQARTHDQELPVADSR